MNNKAFTLVELVGVVLILSLIFLVTYPNIVSMTKKDNTKQYDLMVKNLCLAGEDYIYNRGFTITPNTTISLTIQDLIDYGNVNPNFKDVKTNKKINPTRILQFNVKSDKTLECVFN